MGRGHIRYNCECPKVNLLQFDIYAYRSARYGKFRESTENLICGMERHVKCLCRLVSRFVCLYFAPSVWTGHSVRTVQSRKLFYPCGIVRNIFNLTKHIYPINMIIIMSTWTSELMSPFRIGFNFALCPPNDRMWDICKFKKTNTLHPIRWP